MGKHTLRYILLAAILSSGCLVGCRTNQDVERYEASITELCESGRYFEAYIKYVRDFGAQYPNSGERWDIYHSIRQHTAAYGKEEWRQILGCGEIPLVFKRDLIVEVDCLRRYEESISSPREDRHISTEGPQTQPAASPGGFEATGRISKLKEDRRFFEACKLLPLALFENKDVAEGAGPFLYESTLGAVHHAGRNEWSAIFESPQVPLYLKLDLVEEIHEESPAN